MIVIWGKRLFGKCDQVPGVGYVATQFFHIQFLPLVPLQSFVIEEGSEGGDGFRGVPIPLSIKSILFGWLRAGLVIGAIVGMIASIDNDRPAWVVPLLCAIGI